MINYLQITTELVPQIQKVTEQLREKLLSPFYASETLSWVSADGISFFRGVLAMTFPFLIVSFPAIAWILLSFSVVLDAFDGVVARLKHTNSDRGKFIDMVCDQLTFMSGGFGFMLLLPDLMFPISICMFTIGMLYVIVIFRKNERKATDWIIHPRAQKTLYKVLFLLLIILKLVGILATSHTLIGLSTLIIITGIAILYHLRQFIKKR